MEERGPWGTDAPVSLLEEERAAGVSLACF